MSVIHLPDAARVSVAEAKRLLSEAFPREDVMDVYVNEAGEYHCEVKENANPQAFYLEHDFADTCKQLKISPRHRIRPRFTDYPGPTVTQAYLEELALLAGVECTTTPAEYALLADAEYTITRAELALLADAYGLRVRDSAPALEQAPQAAEVTRAAPATGKPLESKPEQTAPRFAMTKAALITAHEHHWPTIRRDLQDASQNGLSAAKAGSRDWHEEKAMEWARCNGKLAASIHVTPASAMPTLASLPSTRHTLGR